MRVNYYARVLSRSKLKRYQALPSCSTPLLTHCNDTWSHGDVPVEPNIGRTTSSRGKIHNGAMHSIRPIPCATTTLYTLLRAYIRSVAHTLRYNKDLLKSDTEYELTFWSKLNTGAQATAQIVAVSTTQGDYADKEFVLISAMNPLLYIQNLIAFNIWNVIHPNIF